MWRLGLDMYAFTNLGTVCNCDLNLALSDLLLALTRA